MNCGCCGVLKLLGAHPELVRFGRVGSNKISLSSKYNTVLSTWLWHVFLFLNSKLEFVTMKSFCCTSNLYRMFVWQRPRRNWNTMTFGSNKHTWCSSDPTGFHRWPSPPSVILERVWACYGGRLGFGNWALEWNRVMRDVEFGFVSPSSNKFSKGTSTING